MRRYPTSKVRSGHEEILHVQGQRNPSKTVGTGAAVRRYPMSKVRSCGTLCWSSREEIPHIQDQRNPSKMESTGAAVRRYPTPKGEELKQTCTHQDPGTPQRLRENCV